VRLSLRTRLTLVYGALFLITGSALVTVTYLQTATTIDSRLTALGQTLTVYGDGAGNNLYATAGGTSRTRTTQSVGGEVQRQKDDMLSELIKSSVLTLLILGPLAVLLGYVVAGRMLRPLHKMTTTARRLTHSNLHERFALDGPGDEIKELGDTFDAMFDRLHRAFDSQRRFVANASHELRTPLTINRTVLEVALARRNASEETKILAGTLLATTDRHERLVEGLLLLAKSENEPQTRTPVDVAELASRALEDLDVRDVTVTKDLGEGMTAGEPVLLERCVANLLENAVAYNVPKGEIWLSTWSEPGGAVIQVENTGPLIASYDLETIFEPFRRLRPDRTGSAKGSGLGLSIVRSVVRAHGGTIETTARPAGGLRVTLHLPA
jgi:signal transduction histidine kinase